MDWERLCRPSLQQSLLKLSRTLDFSSPEMVVVLSGYMPMCWMIPFGSSKHSQWAHILILLLSDDLHLSTSYFFLLGAPKFTAFGNGGERAQGRSRKVPCSRQGAAIMADRWVYAPNSEEHTQSHSSIKIISTRMFVRRLGASLRGRVVRARRRKKSNR